MIMVNYFNLVYVDVKANVKVYELRKGEAWLSTFISERLTGRRPVREQSERASVDIVG